MMNGSKRTTGITLAWLTCFAAGSVAAEPSLPPYVIVDGVAGNLSSIGSDTLANLMTLWSERFKSIYPAVNIQIQAAGSSTAPTALTEGTANMGPMSRKMTSKERQAFKSRYGYEATPIRVAIDALAVYVHEHNPIPGLSLGEIDAVFSSTRRCGYPRDITRWEQLGVGGRLAKRVIQLYGRNSASGTYGYFKRYALCKGDFKSTAAELLGSASVVQAVSTSPTAIGYSGIGFKTMGVRAVPLKRGVGGDFVDPTPRNVASGEYPLARFLYVYFNKHPHRPLPPLEREFLILLLSREGQAVVAKLGYVPLPKELAAQELDKVVSVQ